MRWVRRIATAAVALLMLIIGVLFALQNQAAVPLDLLLLQLPPQSLAVWLIAAMTLGALLGMGLSAGLVWRVRRRERRRYEHRLAEREAELRSVESLRTASRREIVLRD